MPKRRFTDEEEICIAQIYQSGKSAKAIGRAYKLPGKDSVLGALRRNDVKIRPNTEANRLYTVNHNAFDELTPESVYWWGFIYADGSINRHKTLTVTTRASDQEHLVSLREFLKCNAPVKRINVKLKNKVYPQSHFSITHRHLAKRLEELGVVVRRPTFQFVMDNLPDDLIHHWLRGLFDGDGSVRSSISKKTAPGLGFCGSSALMYFIRKYLAGKAGTNPNLKLYNHPTGLYYLRYSGRRQCIRIAGVLYKDATTWLERKRKIIDSWPNPQIRERDSLGRYI